MDEHFIKIHKWLYPASWLYGAVVMMRNKLFDWEVLQSKSFDIPIISIAGDMCSQLPKAPRTASVTSLTKCTPSSRLSRWQSMRTVAMA